MDEFESYFDTLNFHFSNWSDILENENIDIRSNNAELAEQNVQLLPRQDVSLYGIIPKMEKRSFSTCKDCKTVFNPKDVLLHKNCTVRVKSQHNQHFKKKVKSKKKSPVPLPPLFPTGLEGVPPLEELNTTKIQQNSIFIVNVNELPQTDVAASPMSAKLYPLVEDVESIPLPHTPNLQVTFKDTSNNDIKTANSQDQIQTPNATSKSKKKKSSKTQEPRNFKYSNHTSGNDLLHTNKNSVDSNYFTQDNPQEIQVPLMYMPMSPVSAISPLQIIKEELSCSEGPEQVVTPTECTHQIYLSIPEQLTVKMYKTRPKLGTYPSYNARNIGGAIVISKQKLINQRKDILSAINSKHIGNDILSNYNKSIVRLNKTKNNKLNFRKSNQLRLSPDVNGFIIHAEVPESNEEAKSVQNGKMTMMNSK